MGTTNMVVLQAAKMRTTPEQTDKLMAARCRLMTREPWYGHVAMNMIWTPSQMPWMPEEQRTMGVRIVNGGDIQCLYYPPFVDKLTVEELFAVIQHEIEHIVRVHCVRRSHRNPMGWNIAADMTVNGSRNSPRIGYKKPGSSEIIVPLEGNIVWIPQGWPSDGTSEQFYDMLEKKQQESGGKCCSSCGRPTKGKGKAQDSGDGDDGEDGEGGGSQDGSCKACGQSGEYEYGGVKGQIIDDHSTWDQSDVSEDEARQVIKDVVDQATDKCQGNAPGHLVEAIQELSKPVIRWREQLRQYFGRNVGSRRWTYSRRNRRYTQFGIKGVSRHAACNINVIIDTSGSVGKRELEQFFAEIDSISSRAKVNILQWDHAFQAYGKYRRGDWKKFEVRGRGGTNMADPMYWLGDNDLVADVQVMLTDGYTPWADESRITYPCITVITTPQGTTDGPEYGSVVRMKVE
jgi:predicted metal-dependent peptidase